MIWLIPVVVTVVVLLALIYRRGQANMSLDAYTSDFIAAVKAGRQAGPEPTLPAEPPVPTSFDEAKVLLASWLHNEPVPLLPENREGWAPSTLEGVSYAVRDDRAQVVVERLQVLWLAHGLFVFQSHQGRMSRPVMLGDATSWEPARIGLLPTDDPWEVVRHRGTWGEYEEPETVLDGLKKLHAEAPFRLLLVDVNAVVGQFLAQPPNPRALAEMMLEWAPDVLASQDNDIERFTQEMVNTGSFEILWE